MDPTANTKSQHEDDVQIVPITPADRQRVVEFLRTHYYREEPLASIYKPDQQVQADEDFNVSNIDHGTCVKAIHVPTGRIVGVALAGPKGPDEAKHLFEAAEKEGPTKWGRVLHFLACVERDANAFERYGVNRIMHMHLVAVDKEMRGKNITARLISGITKIAKKLNYTIMTSDCTSYYSQRSCQRLNVECLNTAYYKDYLDENNKQVFTPKPPHECCKTYLAKL